MSEPTETIEFSGPDTGGWHFTQIPDWIPLHPDLKDGAFRLYCILRSLISEKQDEKVRVLSHDQIAFLAVGKNGKPLSASAVKGLLRNLHEVGLVDNPDGKRIVTSTGNGGIETRRRYRLTDWPDRASYLGWRNARAKLAGYSPQWRDSRCDAAPGAVDGQKSDPRADQQRNTETAGHLVGQKSDRAGQKSVRRGQKSVGGEAVTSGNAPSNKSLEEASLRSSSSSAEVEDITHEAAPPVAAEKRKTNEREQAKTLLGERLPDSTDDERDAIINVILAEAAAKGIKVGFLVSYVRGRPDTLLEQDLAQVRRHSAPPTVTVCGDHQQDMPPHGCALCAGEIKAGDPEDIARLRAHLAMVGEKTRPDLARLLGAPQKAPAPRAGGGDAIDWRRMQKKPNGVVGGSRDPIPDHNFWKSVPDDQEFLRNMLFGPPPTTKPPHDPRYAPGTGSYVDPHAQYTEDPKIVFGTSAEANEFSGDF